MSWSFGGVAPSAGQSSSTAAAGPDLEEIQTDALGFQSLGGDAKVRILPQAWPGDRLPPPTASLLSVASSKGLLAAAGPDKLVIASTDAVRAAYTSDAAEQNGGKPVVPVAILQIPRVSQVAFSCDGSCIVIAAEEGGGLAIYDVQAVQQGQQQSAFQLATSGIPIRALVPNPAPEYSHLFAVILAGGQLLMADLKDRKLVTGQGSYFKEGVSCASWSAKGKQLVAGLEDGTAAQFDHQGVQKAAIPVPPQLQAPQPITGIYWLANDDFFTIHTPANGDNSDASYFIVHRDKSSGSFTASKFVNDPVPSFGTRHPAHHFISRLKSFPPALDDMLIVSSTAGADIGVFTRSSVPLVADFPAEQVTNTYTVTMMANDSRRAQMPMSADGMGDTSPLGMAIDLSSKELLKRPLASDDEIEQSAAPLPAFLILNNEGLLSSWWVMYTDSIRQRTAYPGLVNGTSRGEVASNSAIQVASSASSTAQQSSTPAFGSSTFGQAARPAFGAPSTPGFGGASALGNKASPWGTTGQAATTFGKPAFGSTAPAFGTSTPLGTSSSKASAFGAASNLGGNKSPWVNSGPASNAAGPSGASTFGQPSAFGASANTQSGFASLASKPAFGVPEGTVSADASPFAKLGGEDNKSASPFANFGSTATDKPSTSPFAAFGSNTGQKASPFASFGQGDKKPGGSFGSTVTLPSSGASFGQPSTGFSFGKPSALPGSSLSREATMTDDDEGSANKEVSKSSAPSNFGGFKLVSGFKGDGSGEDDHPRPENPGASLFGSSFGDLLGDASKNAPNKTGPEQKLALSTTPSTTANALPSMLGSKSAEVASKVGPSDTPLPPDFIKKEPRETETSINDIPLPSDTTTAPAMSEKKSVSMDSAPLPPDFVTKSKTDEAATASDAPLPPDFLSKTRSTEDKNLPSMAGSPPIVVENGSSDLSPIDSEAEDLISGDEDDDDEDGEEGDEDAEDSDEDHEEWEDETADGEGEAEYDDVETPQVTQQSLAQAASTPFGARLTFGPKAAAPQPQSSTSPLPSTTPAGFPKGPIFAPPQKESPRSPSPIRSISTPAGRTVAKQVANEPISIKPRPLANMAAKPSSTVRSQKPASPAQAETASLSDDEDARIRAILDSDIQPTKLLDPFTAHQDYVGAGDKPGLGGQIENVYRDVNSMIDTLGLNARSLQAFVQGHQTFRRKGGRTVQDLENDEDWCLVEVEDLASVESGIDNDIEHGKLDNVPTLFKDAAALSTDVLRLRTRFSELRRQVALHNDPDKRAAQRNAPLDTETELRQHQLRKAVGQVQRLLQDAEEQSSVLRAELASVPGGPDGKGNSGPTVEAVTNTIMKMTAMIEQKSGDVDVLEAQIRRLPQSIAGLSLLDDDRAANEQDVLRSSVSSMRGSRRGLPISKSTNTLATPAAISRSQQLNRRSMLGGERLGMSGMLGQRFRTPPRGDAAGDRRSLILGGSSPAGGSVLGQSFVGVAGGGERRRMADVSRDEVEAYNARAAQRAKVLGALQGVVEKKGTRVVKVGQ